MGGAVSTREASQERLHQLDLVIIDSSMTARITRLGKHLEGLEAAEGFTQRKTPSSVR